MFNMSLSSTYATGRCLVIALILLFTGCYSEWEEVNLEDYAHIDHPDGAKVPITLEENVAYASGKNIILIKASDGTQDSISMAQPVRDLQWNEHRGRLTFLQIEPQYYDEPESGYLFEFDTQTDSVKQISEVPVYSYQLHPGDSYFIVKTNAFDGSGRSGYSVLDIGGNMVIHIDSLLVAIIPEDEYWSLEIQEGTFRWTENQVVRFNFSYYIPSTDSSKYSDPRFGQTYLQIDTPGGALQGTIYSP